MVARGSLVSIAGQVGLDEATGERSLDEVATFVEQFARALARVVTVLAEARGTADDLVDLTIFVTDLETYRRARPQLGAVWKRSFPSHEPAVTLVEVKGLFDRGACVEISGHAVVSAV